MAAPVPQQSLVISSGIFSSLRRHHPCNQPSTPQPPSEGFYSWTHPAPLTTLMVAQKEAEAGVILAVPQEGSASRQKHKHGHESHHQRSKEPPLPSTQWNVTGDVRSKRSCPIILIDPRLCHRSWAMRLHLKEKIFHWHMRQYWVISCLWNNQTKWLRCNSEKKKSLNILNLHSMDNLW